MSSTKLNLKLGYDPQRTIITTSPLNKMLIFLPA